MINCIRKYKNSPTAQCLSGNFLSLASAPTAQQHNGGCGDQEGREGAGICLFGVKAVHGLFFVVLVDLQAVGELLPQTGLFGHLIPIRLHAACGCVAGVFDLTVAADEAFLAGMLGLLLENLVDAFGLIGRFTRVVFTVAEGHFLAVDLQGFLRFGIVVCIFHGYNPPFIKDRICKKRLFYSSIG